MTGPGEEGPWPGETYPEAPRTAPAPPNLPLPPSAIASKFKADDLVRVVAIQPGTMIESYLGSEGRVISRTPDGLFYTVELDVGRARVDRAGQLGPRFIVREDQLDPDVTEKMIEAGFAAVSEIALTGDSKDEYAKAFYRAMRAARFER